MIYFCLRYKIEIFALYEDGETSEPATIAFSTGILQHGDGKGVQYYQLTTVVVYVLGNAIFCNAFL